MNSSQPALALPLLPHKSVVADWDGGDLSADGGWLLLALAAIRDGRLAEFSLDRLMNCLRSLEQDVTISVRPATEGSGRILVTTG